MKQEVDVCVEGEAFNVIEILSIIIGVISLFIIIFIGYISLPKLRTLAKLESSFKYLFYTSWISTLILIILAILSTFFCIYNDKITSLIMVTIAIYFYYILLLSLLATLLCRLHYTFIDSVYKISKKIQNVMIICFIIICILAICNLISDTISFFDKIIFKQNLYYTSTLAMIFGASCIIQYTLTASFAMYIFSNNLIKLTHLQATSPPHVLPINSIQSVTGSNDDSSGSRSSSFMIPAPKYKLNQKQIELIENISKYVSLLSMAILSSLIVAITILCGIWIKDIVFRTHFFQIILIFICVDCVININCLYLQYSFAINHYNTYCQCIHLFCKYLLKTKAKKSGQQMYKESINLMRDNNPSIIKQQICKKNNYIQEEEEEEEEEKEEKETEQHEIIYDNN